LLGQLDDHLIEFAGVSNVDWKERGACCRNDSDLMSVGSSS
jgi:hypothetical protein